MAKGSDSGAVGMVIPPPLYFAGALVLGLLVDWVAGIDWRPHPGVRLIGAAVLLVGGILLLGALKRFQEAGTPPEPWAAATALATGGVYRFTRNPMYLGMALSLLGLALLAASPAALALTPVAVILCDRLQIVREERYMAGRFGQAYRDYCARVRRWI